MTGPLIRVARAERGIVAVWVGLLAVVLVGVGAFATDVSRWYVEGERLQKAVDNAATAGVVYLPGDVNAARTTAQQIAESNGWVIDGTDVTFAADPEPDRPSRLRVTMSSDVDGILGVVLGVTNTRITRTAVADYGPPAAVGNPCSVFGNQDMEDPANRVDSSTCTNNAEYWLNIAGDNTNKARGDGFGSGWCTKPDDGKGIDNCITPPGPRTTLGSEGINADHSNQAGVKTFPGYLYTFRPTVAGEIQLSAYDMGWVATGDDCKANQQGSQINGATGNNDFVSDGADRYRTGNSSRSPFCSGDTLMNHPEGDKTSATDWTAVETRVTIRGPSPNPWEPLGGPEICTGVFPGWGIDTPKDALDSTKTDVYDIALARTFHRWSGLCVTDQTSLTDQRDFTRITVPAANVGEDYVVQVETSGPGGTRGGGGQNRFALRAEHASAGGDAVSISAVDKFSVFVNTESETTRFNIIRLDSSTAGKGLEVRLFDLGDTSGNLEVDATLLAPDGSPFASCTGEGPVVGSLTNCTVRTKASVNGGRWQTIRAPIPGDYSCANDDDQTQCWATLRIQLASSGAGKQNDTTTWTAKVVGEPVRIVE